MLERFLNGEMLRKVLITKKYLYQHGFDMAQFSAK